MNADKNEGPSAFIGFYRRLLLFLLCYFTVIGTDAT
jgi:hypothetical protein